MDQQEDSRERLLDSLIAEYLSATEAGQEPNQAEFLARHPDFVSDLRSFFRNREIVQGLTGDTGHLPRLFGDLENWLDGRPILARPVGRMERLWRWCRRKPLAAALVAAGVIVVVLILLRVTEQFARRDEILESNGYIAKQVASVMLDRLQEWGAKVEEASTRYETLSLLRDWNRVVEDFSEVPPETLLERPEGLRLQEYCERLAQDRAFDTWHVIDARGIMVARTPRHKIIGMDFKERDYFQGTLRHVGKTGRAALHVSSVFRSVADTMYKFNICWPVVDGDRLLEVMNTSLTTDASMGIAYLHDERRKAVLVAPWDRNRRRNDPILEAQPPDYLLLLHPGYRKHGEDAVGIESLRLPDFGGCRCGEELQAHASAKGSESRRDYADPFAARDPAFSGQWLAGFAPVGNTGFIVIIQQRDE